MATEQLAETVRRLHEVIEPPLAREGLELVDLELQRNNRGHVLRILVDRIGEAPYPTKPRREVGEELTGVSIHDCVRVSKMLGPLLDVEDLMPTAYTFEVSSPGVNRPLRKPAHFRRALGAQIRVKTRVVMAGSKLHIAKLDEVDDEGIVIAARSGPLAIPFRLISDARLEFEF